MYQQHHQADSNMGQAAVFLAADTVTSTTDAELWTIEQLIVIVRPLIFPAIATTTNQHNRQVRASAAGLGRRTVRKVQQNIRSGTSDPDTDGGCKLSCIRAHHTD